MNEKTKIEVFEDESETEKIIEEMAEVRAENNKKFAMLSEEQQVDYLKFCYGENKKIIDKLGLKTINEVGEVNG